jgi:hypothetical protein
MDVNELPSITNERNINKFRSSRVGIVDNIQTSHQQHVNLILLAPCQICDGFSLNYVCLYHSYALCCMTQSEYTN